MTVLLARNQRNSRYLFDWSARYSLERTSDGSISGQAATFTRASIGSTIGTDGRLQIFAHSQPRWEWYDLDGDGVKKTPFRVIEDTRTNLALQSENFGTTWAAQGTPTRVAGASGSAGFSFDLIGDDSASVREGYGQVITFTGNGVKVICAMIAQNTSTSSAIELFDTTASADRMYAVITWSGGLPVVTATGGTFLGYQQIVPGIFRIMLATTSVTAANTNTLFVWPATDSAGSGTLQGAIYVSGVQAENATYPSSYIKTTTATVTRALENLSLTFASLPQALTLYAKFIERGTCLTGTAAQLVSISGASTPRLFIYNDTTNRYALNHNNGTTGVEEPAAAGPSFGQAVELRGVLGSDGSVTLGQCINGGTEVVGPTSAANALAGAWGAATLEIGSLGATTGLNAFSAVRVAAGNRSLAFMREGG